MTTKNAIIKDADLKFEYDGLFLCLNITLDYGDSYQTFGGVSLGYRYMKAFNPTGGDYAFWWIKRVFDVAEVDTIRDLKGKSIRVKIDNNREIVAIGHIIKDDWFCPKEDFLGGKEM